MDAWIDASAAVMYERHAGAAVQSMLVDVAATADITAAADAGF
jgi:hypothetical protein